MKVNVATNYTIFLQGIKIISDKFETDLARSHINSKRNGYYLHV